MNHMFENEPYKYLATGQVEQIPHVTAKTCMIHINQCYITMIVQFT